MKYSASHGNLQYEALRITVRSTANYGMKHCELRYEALRITVRATPKLHKNHDRITIQIKAELQYE